MYMHMCVLDFINRMLLLRLDKHFYWLTCSATTCRIKYCFEKGSFYVENLDRRKSKETIFD